MYVTLSQWFLIFLTNIAYLFKHNSIFQNNFSKRKVTIPAISFVVIFKEDYTEDCTLFSIRVVIVLVCMNSAIDEAGQNADCRCIISRIGGNLVDA